MDMFSILIFIVIVGTIGIFAFKKSRAVDNNSADGYFLGGRSLTGVTIAGAIIMTNLSTEQIVGQNGQSYVGGMEVMAWEVTSAIACVLLALVFLPKYLKYGVSTVSDFIEIRYDTATKRVVSALFIFTYMTSFLPVVLYSGSLVFNKIFRVDQALGVDKLVAVGLIAAVIGVIGLLYLLIGGLSLSAFSDTIYGVALLVIGLSIPVFGLIVLGDGHFLNGMKTVKDQTPHLLNAIGPVDSTIVPWPTLFMGMLFNNLFFWCTNQMIVQKTLAGKSLKEGQKGALYVAFFKIFGALFLVFPGIIGFNLLGDGLVNADDVYPSLVTAVLPQWGYGIFAAVIFGAILSSFVGALNATATLFTLDFYKPMIKKDATDQQVARAGKFVTIIVGLISVTIAPFISFAPAGLYAVVQEFNGIYSMPLLALVVLGFYSKYVTAFAAKVTFAFHIIIYGLSKIFLDDVHYLYVLGYLFLADVFVMWFIGKMKPLHKPFAFEEDTNKVDLTPWKHRKWVSVVVIITMVGTYLFFSPWGIAS
ncbi:solute:sodium symporter family transporter [Bacillaceae bacterium SIJ1]|uniref:solute:sodium symporter family transporter n=1 Tax=Litoribacterium kuwaitense TaxID=1398745 RepID=UPI0013E9AC73|nr:solute:sodium symporter family transporter [Litoribacterium kuwaitense]NGP46103.1 solute:sodium symporter family transporter [Litoribacterium kuwaitense]